MSGLDGVSIGSAPISLPADVRAAGKEGEQTYRVALGFERVLLEQLTQSIAKDAVAGGTGGGEDGEDGGGASAATSTYRDMLPGTLADAVTGAGGIGLAHDLFLSMRSAS
jgi:Rod binding domain-containing protein